MTEDEILGKSVEKFRFDPLGFVLWSFPWGEGELSSEEGPDVWQTECLTLIGQFVRGQLEMDVNLLRLIIASGHGIGKAHPVDMVVETPQGKKRWGDLKAGDFVFGRDGKPTKIKQTHPQGVKPVYDVTFDDRSKAQTCAKHLWRVHHRKRGWEIRTTESLMESGVGRPNGSGRLRSYHIPRHDAVEFPYQWTHVDPYTLGAWLGDGTRGRSQITNMDMEVFDRIRQAGYKLTEHKSDNCGRASLFNIGHLRPALERLGIDQCKAQQKYVPDVYKYNLSCIRAEVLRGLIDTDGFVTPTGTVQFTSASKQLVEDVMWLTRSLGGKARIYSTTKDNAWTCSLTFPDGFQPCYINRPTTQKRYLERYIESIEPAGEAECMCITVEADDELYLANDFIVTHNTCLIAWIILWFISTRHNPQIVVTANTGTQLQTKTWRELSIWHQKMKHNHWFKWTATSYKHAETQSTWFASAIPWSKDRSQAFAGTHAKHTLFIFDEGSEIADVIWEVTEGAFSDCPEGGTRIWVVFGNPTSNTGRFKESAAGRWKHRWYHKQIDSRSAARTDKAKIAEDIKDYGEDSDFVRVRWKGMFPRASSSQFIPEDVVEEARQRNYHEMDYVSAARVVGLDIARFGDDRTVFITRQGIIASDLKRFRNLSADITYQKAKEVLEAGIGPTGGVEDPSKFVDMLFLDMGNIGAAVYDLLYRHEVFRDRITGIWYSEAAEASQQWFNKRSEMWGRMRHWLKQGGAIPDDQELRTDLIGPLYGLSAKEQVQLESGPDMKARGLASPDCAMALAQTFYENVFKKEMSILQKVTQKKRTHYDPMARGRRTR